MQDMQCTISSKLAALNHEIQMLSEMVIKDPLTELFNVRHLRFCLEQEMERTQRSRQASTLVLLDIDHFKSFNDTHGHVVGDKVLQHVARVIKTAIRKIDIPCRYGGEEFAVILPSTPVLIGSKVAERIRQKLEVSPLVEQGQSLNITISGGVGGYTPSDVDEIDDFIARADQCLYRAKHEGRNRIVSVKAPDDSASPVSEEEKDALFGAPSDKRR